MRIWFYQPKTVKAYRNALTDFLRWFGNRPHRVTREDVHAYLGEEKVPFVPDTFVIQRHVSLSLDNA